MNVLESNSSATKTATESMAEAAVVSRIDMPSHGIENAPPREYRPVFNRVGLDRVMLNLPTRNEKMSVAPHAQDAAIDRDNENSYCPPES